MVAKIIAAEAAAPAATAAAISSGSDPGGSRQQQHRQRQLGRNNYGYSALSSGSTKGIRSKDCVYIVSVLAGSASV